MKRGFVLILFLVATLSCDNKGNQPKIVEELYSPTQEELYSQCAELKGIGEFVIGETTFQQAIHSKVYANTYGRFFMNNNFYNGYWGVYKENGNHEISDWIENKGRSIKQLPCPSLSISIGQIKLDNFDLAFYDNKLAAIFFKTDNGDLHKHYIDKYGNGKGTYYSYHLDNEPCEDREKLESTETIKEDRTWENEQVRLEYHHDYHFEMGPNMDFVRTYKNDSWYLLSSKSLYPKFLDELKKQIDAFNNQKQDKEKEVLNQF